MEMKQEHGSFVKEGNVDNNKNNNNPNKWKILCLDKRVISSRDNQNKHRSSHRDVLKRCSKGKL